MSIIKVKFARFCCKVKVKVKEQGFAVKITMNVYLGLALLSTFYLGMIFSASPSYINPELKHVILPSNFML